jgi:hypothetical protein
MTLQEDEKAVGWNTKRAKNPMNASFVHAAEYEINNGEKWGIYIGLDANEKGWIVIRLSRREKAGGRCHYRLGWNAGLCRFANGRELFSLRVNRQELFEAVCVVLKEREQMYADWVYIANTYETKVKI